MARERVGWKKRAPKGRFERRQVLKKYGAKCFLVPDKTKPGFPVCTKRGVYDCQGIKAAFARAKQTGRAKIARKATRLACRLGCTWTKRQDRCRV